MTKTRLKAFTFIKFCLVFITGFCLTWYATAATEFKIITLQHRFAEDVLPAILPLVGEQGSASAIHNNLIIRTSPENMAEIEQVVSTLDTEPHNLRITISRNLNQRSETNNAEVSSRIRIGNAVVKTGNTRQIIGNGATLNIENQQNKSNLNSNQFIQVIDGAIAFISVGQSIPYTQEWISLTHRYASTQRTTQFITFDTGFAVRPRTISNQVELEVTPRFSQVNQKGIVDFETFTSVIRTERGKWIDLAGIMQQKDVVSREILNWATKNQSSNTQLFIMVE